MWSCTTILRSRGTPAAKNNFFPKCAVLNTLGIAHINKKTFWRCAVWNSLFSLPRLKMCRWPCTLHIRVRDVLHPVKNNRRYDPKTIGVMTAACSVAERRRAPDGRVDNSPLRRSRGARPGAALPQGLARIGGRGVAVGNGVTEERKKRVLVPLCRKQE
jgi:hypothetical protein